MLHVHRACANIITYLISSVMPHRWEKSNSFTYSQMPCHVMSWISAVSTEPKVDDKQEKAKTFRLTSYHFVLVCTESQSINNQNCSLRVSPRGLISLVDPSPVTGMAWAHCSRALALCIVPSVSRFHTHSCTYDRCLGWPTDFKTLPLKWNTCK